MQDKNQVLEKRKERQKVRTNSYRKKHRRSNKSQNKKKGKIIKSIALERIEYLMDKAVDMYSLNPELADRYVDISRRYSMSVKVRMPQKYKRIICHKCKKLMVPGVSSRSRIQSRKKHGSRIVTTCLHCGNMAHIFFKARNRKDSIEPPDKADNGSKPIEYRINDNPSKTDNNIKPNKNGF